MAANRAWLDANLGRERVEGLAALAAPAATPTAEDLALERIEFDSKSAQGEAFLARRVEAVPDIDAFREVPWPKGLAPRPAPAPPAGDSLPKADVLIVTWTIEEGRALSRVLTPGFESHTPRSPDKEEPGVSYWKRYVKNYAEIAAHMSPGCPAVHTYQRLGTYWTAEIAGKSVVLFKSDSHMSQDGARTPEKTPNRLVWKQIIEDCKPQWVITTGTGGGIGPEIEVGDVVVSRYVTFDPGGRRDPSPQLEAFSCPVEAPHSRFTDLKALLQPNAKFLPKENTRSPRVLRAGDPSQGVVTTEGFAYDDTSGTYHLKGKGTVCEMGDAVLGLVCREMDDHVPNYVSVRNASDPEMDSSSGPETGKIANEIYEHFGCWSSVCSALVSWAIVAGL